MHQAKSNLSELVVAVHNGTEVTIAKAGKPVARLVAIRQKPQKLFGSMKHQIQFSPDYDSADKAVEKLFTD